MVTVEFTGAAEEKLRKLWRKAEIEYFTQEEEEWIIEYVLTACDAAWEAQK